MPDIHPNDIGLATFADVGDVAKLRTTAKNTVDAINELFQSLGNASGMFGKQIYIDGENNVVIGENNVVYGNNNLVVGSDNIVVGDNINLIANTVIKHKVIPGFSVLGFDFGTNTVSYSNTSSELPIAIGSKAAIKIAVTWTNSDWDDSVTYESEVIVADILNIDAETHKITLSDLGLSSIPPDDIHTIIDSVSVSVFIPLNTASKLSGTPDSLSFGTGTATGSRSVNTGSGNASGASSFAANNSNSSGTRSAAFNSSLATATDAFSTNLANCLANYAAAFNTSYNYAPYSVSTGYYTRIFSRALRCVSLDTSNKLLTIEPGQNITGLAGSKIVIRCYNPNLAVVFVEGTISKVASNVLTLTNIYFSSGTNVESLFPEPFAFVIDSTLIYATSNFVGGMHSVSASRYAFAYGLNVLAAVDGAAVFGKYGNLTDQYSLALANGTSLKEPGIAFKALSDGSVHADAEYTSPCADYAEYFEWLDGNPSAEDRVGYFVKLNGEKIEFCGDFDEPLGIVSAKPAIIGDSGELHWNNKYITDDFGRIKYHDVVIPAEFDAKGNIVCPERIESQPVINPDWDSNLKYIPRKERPEWSPVGVLGKLTVYDDGTLKSGDICRPGAGGIAVKSIKNGYHVLKRIAKDKVQIWFC